MNLPAAPDAYDRADALTLRAELIRADGENHKRNRHLELGRGARLVLTDEASGQRYALFVSGGVLTLAAL